MFAVVDWLRDPRLLLGVWFALVVILIALTVWYDTRGGRPHHR